MDDQVKEVLKDSRDLLDRLVSPALLEYLVSKDRLDTPDTPVSEVPPAEQVLLVQQDPVVTMDVLDLLVSADPLV